MISPTVFAAHPLVSEDTGTQGTGNAELEIGSGWSKADGNRSYQVQPQFTYGLSTMLDLIVQPSWLSNNDPYNSKTRGLGDTNLDAKWRFYGTAPWSFGIRAGFQLPTGEHGLGLPNNAISPHAVLVATYDEAPFTTHVNLGYTYLPNNSGQRTDLYHASSAVMFAASEKLVLTFEAIMDSNPDPARSNTISDILAGVIYTVSPGLDVDAGYLAGLNSTSMNREWLLGITYRWAP